MLTEAIRTEAEYQDALAEAKRLVALDPDPDSAEGEKLELLALLIEEYESQKYQFNVPDPIDALLFRMEQQGLTRRDLIPYLGSRSKVSEVLARKRPLTLTMSRALNEGLGIPAQALFKKSAFQDKSS